MSQELGIRGCGYVRSCSFFSRVVDTSGVSVDVFKDRVVDVSGVVDVLGVVDVRSCGCFQELCGYFRSCRCLQCRVVDV